MKKIVDIVNGNRMPFIATLSIIMTLIISSVIIAGKISDIEKSLKQYVDERIDEQVDQRLFLLEYKINMLQTSVDRNQEEIIEIIKGK